MPIVYILLHLLLISACLVLILRSQHRPRMCYALGAAVVTFLSVGLRSDCPAVSRYKMIGYGWQPGLRHAVVLLSVEPDGYWISMADPSFGRERWPTEDLRYLWDGYVVVLE